MPSLLPLEAVAYGFFVVKGSQGGTFTRLKTPKRRGLQTSLKYNACSPLCNVCNALGLVTLAIQTLQLEGLRL